MKRKIIPILCFLFTGISFAQKPSDTLSLYFKNDAHTPILQHIKSIDSITDLEKLFFRKIDVIGYTNSLGATTYNQKLSKKRAQNIANKIHNHNLGKVLWRGELPTSSYKNRRVDLIIHYEEITEVEEIIETTTSKNLDFVNTIKAPEKKNISEEFSSKISKIAVGDKIVLDHVHFKGGLDILKDSSYPALWDLFNYLKENPMVTFKIQGHICCSPNEDPIIDGVNNRTGKRDLSTARAYKVFWFLKERGIDEARMSFEGLAHQFPQGLEDRTLDRRVEIEITSK